MKRLKSLSCIILLVFVSSCSFFQELKHKKDGPSFEFAWIQSYDPSYITGNLPIHPGNPYFYEGLLFVGDPEGMFYSYRQDSGATVWKQKEDSAILSGAFIWEDTVFYGTSRGHLIARDAYTGELRFKVLVGQSVVGQPKVYQDRLFVQLLNHSIMSLDAKTGKILWHYQRSVSQKLSLLGTSQMAFFNNTLLCGFADGSLAAFDVQEGNLLWEQKLSFKEKFPDLNYPLVVNSKGLVLAPGPSEHYSIVNAKDGSILLRKTLKSSKGIYYDAQTQKTYLGGQEGRVFILDADFNLLETVDLNLPKWETVRIAHWGDFWFLVDIKGAVKVLDNNFVLVKNWDLGHRYSNVYGQIAIEGQYLAIYSARNRLYVLRK